MPETYYVKKDENFEPVAYLPRNVVYEGLWLIEKNKGVNIDWLIKKCCNIEDPIDLIPLASLMTLRDDLTQHLLQLQAVQADQKYSLQDYASSILFWISQHCSKKIELRKEHISNMFPHLTASQINDLSQDSFLLKSLISSHRSAQQFGI